MKFSSEARMTQDWTTDRAAISRAVERVEASGGTAHLRRRGAGPAGRRRGTAPEEGHPGHLRRQRHEQRFSVRLLRTRIRESDVLVYALGVDGTARTESTRRQRPPIGLPIPDPFPWPRRAAADPACPRRSSAAERRALEPYASGERVNGDALRDADRRHRRAHGDRARFRRIWRRATARLANELSKQYYLGYSSTEPKDGRWHSIRVDVRDRKLNVRARRGYVAS